MEKPESGGELTYKLFEMKSKGSYKLNGVKGGWWMGNDDLLVFHFRNFNPNSTACKEEMKTAWAATKGDETKQRGISHTKGSL